MSRNSLIFFLPELIDNSVVVGAHLCLQGFNHGVGGLTGRFCVGLVLPLCAAHYRRKKTLADVDLVDVAVESETIYPLLGVLKSTKSVAASTWPGMRAGSLLDLSSPTATVRPLTGSVWSLFVAMSVEQRNIIYFSALEKKNCL